MSEQRGYPARADAELDPQVSRWLWLVKWLLAVPHYICLAFLWMAFVVLGVVAFFAILFTGRFPRAVFEFNLGVLRWTWRVAFYANGAFGTDRYPPFSLRDDPDYPAHFDVDYPQRLSRGLVLVKWWLLAIPQYIVVGVLCGGGAWTLAVDQQDDWRWQWGGGGLIGILAVVAAVILLFTGRYPRNLFDLLVGLNRWVLRVAAYAALMTDEYPPFRLDLGGRDPGSPTLGEGTGAPAGRAVAQPGEPAPAAYGTPPVGPTPAGPVAHRWTAGRVVAVVAGSILVLASTGPLVGGVALAVADRVARTDGYVTSSEGSFSTAGNALLSEKLEIFADGPDWALPDRVLGTVRVRVTGADPARPVFVGIGPTDAVRRYLADTPYATVSTFAPGRVAYAEHAGTQTPAAPAAQTFWASTASGTGRQTLTWRADAGDWTVAVLNADASSGVDVTADVAGTVPALGWLAVALFVVGAVLLVAGVVLVVVAVRTASHGPGPQAPPGRAAPQEPTVVG